MNRFKNLTKAEEVSGQRETAGKKKEGKLTQKLDKEKSLPAQSWTTSTSDKKSEEGLHVGKTAPANMSAVPAEHTDLMSSSEGWVGINYTPPPEELNVGWPWIGVPSNLLTQAPYALNEHNLKRGFFTMPQEVQTSPLFNIPRGMESPILQILFQHHSCASKFAATCQSAFNMVASNIHHWDFSRSNYNNCDDDLQGRTKSPGSIGKIVVVSQFRVRKWREENFECDMWSLQRMTHAMVNFAHRFEILHLHRIPMLTTHLLEMVVPLMTKLKVLGIYRCELLHFGDTLKLLEIVRKHRNYGSGKTHITKLDFYPRFHVGPVNNPARYGKGIYGVTWDNFILDSRLAIWQLLTRILPQAKMQGVDLVSQDSAFRFWLEQSPCWRVEETINAIDRGDDGVKLVVQVNFPSSYGRKGRLAWDEEHWHVKKYHCRACKQTVLGIFFDFEEYTMHAWHSNCNYEMLCLGCKLVMHLGFETDHRKTHKHHMVSGWLGNPSLAVKEGDIEKALANGPKRKGLKYAKHYEVDRKEKAAKNPGEEMQKPRVKHGKYSPSIYDRERHGEWA